MTAVTVAAGAVVVGLLSAFVPVANAEAAAALAAVAPATAGPLWCVVLGLAAGQTLGKLVFVVAGHRLAGRLRRRARGRSTRSARTARPTAARGPTALGRLSAGARRLSTRVLDQLHHPRRAAGVVLMSAGVGVPPLAAVSVAAGAAGQSRLVFAAACLTGRTARFATIAALLPSS